MSLYIRSLIVVDDSDNIVYKTTNIKADKALKELCEIVELKDHKSKFLKLKDYLRGLDNEFKNYFDL
jgi:hypothetical protein